MLTKSKSSKNIIELAAVSMCMSSTAHKFGKVMLWLLGQETIITKEWEDRGYLFSAHSDHISWSVFSY